MAKWNCYTVNGWFAGVVEATTMEEALWKAIDEFRVKVTRVEKRPGWRARG